MGQILVTLLVVWGAHAQPVKPTHSVECVLNAVASHMNIQLKPEIALPDVRLASDVTLKEFQDDVEPQWGMRPDLVLNVFVIAKNRIYLLDDGQYYGKYGRTIDDSLAHELTHYLQVKYRNHDVGDDASEMEAIMEQTWFRETYMAKGVSPCSPL